MSSTPVSLDVGAASNPVVEHTLAAITLSARGIASAVKPWTRVQDALPEQLPDGRQFSREVLVVDGSTDNPPRISRLHYYDNHPSVWDDGDPTHWCDIPDLPDEQKTAAN